jgi:uncharacterized membrane protein YbhN (UPF0104 family)
VKRHVVSASIALLSLALLAYLGREYTGELHRFSEVSPTTCLALLILYFLARGSGGEVVRVALGRLGHRVRHGEAFMLAIVTSYSNLFVPRSGLGPPALYLKIRRHVALSHYAAVALATTFLNIVVVGLLGLMLQVELYFAGAVGFNLQMSLFFAGTFVAAVCGLLIPSPVLSVMPLRIRERLEGPRAAWRELSRDRASVAWMLALQLASILLRGLRLQVALRAAGAEVDFVNVLIASLLADVAALVSLTPAALGFREAAIVYGSTLIGVPPPTALLAAALDRIVTSLGIAVLGQFFVWLGLRDLRDRADGEEESPVHDVAK